MDHRTTKFDVEIEHLNYYLGIHQVVDIDYWTEEYDKYILWSSVIIQSPQGIHNIYGIAKTISFWLRFKVDMDDLKQNEEEHLINTFNCNGYNGYLEGSFWVNTSTDKDWQIEFSVESTPTMIPRELRVSFMDKIMEVV